MFEDSINKNDYINWQINNGLSGYMVDLNNDPAAEAEAAVAMSLEGGYPSLFDDIRLLAKNAKLAQVPLLYFNRDEIGEENAFAGHFAGQLVLVLNRTLLKAHPPCYVRQISGHEIAHMALGHVTNRRWSRKRLNGLAYAPLPRQESLFYPLMSGLQAAAKDVLEWEYKPHDEKRDEKGKLAFDMVQNKRGYYLRAAFLAVLCRKSRRREFQADRVGAVIAGGAESLIAFFNNLVPERPEKFFARIKAAVKERIIYICETHPRPAKRAKKLKRFSRRHERKIYLSNKNLAEMRRALKTNFEQTAPRGAAAAPVRIPKAGDAALGL